MAGGTAQGNKRVAGGTVSNASKVVGDMRPGFSQCYNARLAKNPNQEGTVRLTMYVNCDGQVYAVEAKSRGLDAEVTPCLRGVVEQSKFAPPTGGQATVVLPVTLVRQRH